MRKGFFRSFVLKLILKYATIKWNLNYISLVYSIEKELLDDCGRTFECKRILKNS
jgi:hypothetical protein